MNFEVEWLDAPGVTDRLLAATWARLRIRAGGSDLVELLHLPSDHRRSSVYGSVLPLVEWIVENWWHLLYEPSPSSPLSRGRGAPAWRLPWNGRHNLLAARDGSALPDATLARDGEDIVLRWFPDGPEAFPRRVRFVGEGLVRVPVPSFQDAASALIYTTLARLNELAPGDESVGGLTEAWAEIRQANEEERRLCRSLAQLGVDPYDPEEACPSLVELVAVINREFRGEADLLSDLFEGTSPGRLEEAVAWLRQSLPRPDATRRAAARTTLPPDWAASAHQTGYRLARRARSELLGVPPKDPIGDLHGALVDRLGWDTNPVDVRASDLDLHGLVTLSSTTGKPYLVEPAHRTPWAERFLLARAAFFATTASLGRGRLLTRAVTRHQRAARAFAAELLAPASALAEFVSGVVSADAVAELSDRFGVNPLLIGHQIENHGIGHVAA